MLNLKLLFASLFFTSAFHMHVPTNLHSLFERPQGLQAVDHRGGLPIKENSVSGAVQKLEVDTADTRESISVEDNELSNQEHKMSLLISDSKNSPWLERHGRAWWRGHLGLHQVIVVGMLTLIALMISILVIRCRSLKSKRFDRFMSRNIH